MQISREKHQFRLKEKASAMALRWINAGHGSETTGEERFKQAYGVIDST